MKESYTNKIVLLAGVGEYPIMVYNYLIEKDLKIERLVIEDPINKWIFLKRRVNHLGALNVMGQILNRVFIVTFKATSARRLQEIKDIGGLNSTPPKKILSQMCLQPILRSV